MGTGQPGNLNILLVQNNICIVEFDFFVVLRLFFFRQFLALLVLFLVHFDVYGWCTLRVIFYFRLAVLCFHLTHAFLELGFFLRIITEVALLIRVLSPGDWRLILICFFSVERLLAPIYLQKFRRHLIFIFF